jgi:DNA-binding transcriptional LysR family regulator
MLRELEERGTLGAVAAALGYSPSAVSQQLAVLEREVGVRLLEKAGRGVRLTDAGQLLSRHAHVLLSAAEAAGADLGTLDLAVSDDADVQLELVRRTGAVALLPAMTLPTADPALAIRDVADAAVKRRLVVVTRDGPTAPAVDAFLAAVTEQANHLRRRVTGAI